MIIKPHPRAIKEQNTYNSLPLYAALWNNASMDTIKMLYVLAYHDTVKVKDKNGQLSLHHSVLKYHAMEETYDVIKMLLDSYNEAAKVNYNDGDLPLDYALKNQGLSNDVIKMIIEANPEAFIFD